MALARIEMSMELLGLNQMLDALGRAMGPETRANVLGDALEKAIEPVFRRLYETTPIGPTGNLNRARDKKVVRYHATGVAVGLVGFRRAGRAPSKSANGGNVRTGPDRGYHQWWLEEGTDFRWVTTQSMTPFTRKSHVRRTKYGDVTVRAHMVSSQGGYIASSYFSNGPFKIEGKSEEGRVQTNPGYPRAFFRKSKNPIRINPMPVGGYYGRPPLETAFADMRSTVAEYLSNELRASFERIFSAMTYSPTGTI